MNKPIIFIDGQEGTTGLQIFDRLSARDDIELLTIPESRRKDPSARKSPRRGGHRGGRSRG